MGYSRWDDTVYATASATLSATRNAALSRGYSADAARREVFTQNYVNALFDPKGVMLRESRDSELNPQSTPIILGLDVTGSMGFVAEKIALEKLGDLVGGIIDRCPVPDPHIMVMAIGDAFSDQAPLQVSQFESDIRIVEQLKSLWLEGNGGGNSFESYDLPWYFAGRRTSCDSFEKRGKKGYLFTIGDEPPPPRGLTADQINKIFNGGEECGYTSAEMLALAQEKYNVFHVIAEEGSYARRAKESVKAEWQKLLGRKVILLDNSDYISEVILSVIEINEGADPEEVINSWENEEIKRTVRHAINLATQ